MSAKTLSAKLQRWLPPNPRIVIALSGGPDSVFLAEKLVRIIPNEHLAVAHFDHALRAKSVADAEFCRQWAKRNDVQFFTDTWQNPQHSEGKAREERMAFLRSVAEEFKADAIALGTHADDETETILFRFLRGSGIAGLSGIKPFDAKTKLFRPFLHMQKAEILMYLDSHNIAHQEDETNAESDYSRNYLRNEICPLLQKKFPDFGKRIRRQARVFRATQEFLETEAKRFLAAQEQPDAKEIRTSRPQFAELAEILQFEVIRQLFYPEVPVMELTLEIRDFLVVADAGKYKTLGEVEIAVYSDYFFIRRT